MSPLTHLLASWVIAAKTTDNPRDTRLVALAGLIPDADGMGLAVDLFRDPSLQRGAFYYQEYHHWLAHGIAGGIVISMLLACFARRRLRVFLLAMLVFHLHLLCDLLGSRGETVNDLWPIFYLGPFTRNPMWMWTHQWALDGWQNRIIGCGLFIVSLQMAINLGHSFVGVFNRRLDAVVVRTLQKLWRNSFSKSAPQSQQQ